MTITAIVPCILSRAHCVTQTAAKVADRLHKRENAWLPLSLLFFAPISLGWEGEAVLTVEPNDDVVSGRVGKALAEHVVCHLALAGGDIAGVEIGHGCTEAWDVADLRIKQRGDKSAK